MIIKLRHDNDGKHERVRFFSSTDEDKTYALMGMLAMDKDEFLVLKMA